MKPLYVLLAIVGTLCLLVGGLLVPELASMRYETTRDSLNKGIPGVNPERPVFAFRVDYNCDQLFEVDSDGDGIPDTSVMRNRCPLNQSYELPLDRDGDGDYDMMDYRLHLEFISEVATWHPSGWVKCLEQRLWTYWTRAGQCWLTAVDGETCMELIEGQEVWMQEYPEQLYWQAIQWMTGPR